MHNRVRMITASSPVKDLHIDWTLGARHFMDHLIDGDLASNQHGWQWTAGTGTDPAPYFRIFNPVSQSRNFDPDGNPSSAASCRSCSALPSTEIHDPWRTTTRCSIGRPRTDRRSRRRAARRPRSLSLRAPSARVRRDRTGVPGVEGDATRLVRFGC